MFKIEVTDNKIIFRIFGAKITLQKPFRIKNNQILLIDKNNITRKVKRIKGLKIIFQGANSTVCVHEPYRFKKKCQVILGDNCRVTFGENVNIRNVDIRAVAENSVAEFGKSLSWGGGGMIFLAPEPNTKFKIGDNCLLSREILMQTSDSHKIYDINDSEQKPLNKGADIEIGNHVWIGYHAIINKNAKIPDNSVVGANSFVNKRFYQNNIIIAGQPARKVKENINWDMKF